MIISYAQNFEDVMLWRALKHIECGFYIDVGANDPVVDSVTKLFYEHGWCGINIEPLASHWQALQQSRSRDINLQCALGAFEGEIKLWECGVRGLATADEEVISQHIANGLSGQFITVCQTTLNQVWLLHVPSEVHFLKIDVEGFERSVLEGLDLQRFRPWIVVVESNRPNTTLENHAKWESLLIESNYQFAYMDGLNRFYLADEHHELTGAFKYPPNFFDNFVKAPHKEGNLWAQTISDRADQALQDLAQANARINNMLNSTSWRITVPLRIVSNGLRRLKPIPSRKGLANGIARAIRYITSRPRLRNFGAQVLTRFPTIKSRLKNLMRSSSVSSVGQGQEMIPVNLAHLSPRVRELYSALRREWMSLTRPPVNPLEQTTDRRLRLAYVSPLPPVRSGIADYSAELLPVLAEYYDIDVITEQPLLPDCWIERHCGVRDSKWLLQKSEYYDRVLYHFGNSSHHQHMFGLLARVPGVVVLHDFYLGDVLNYLELYAIDSFASQRGLYKSHGYGALASRFEPNQFARVVEQYPINLEVLQLAQGVIVHSQHAKQLAGTWYGERLAKNWSLIPLLRNPNIYANRNAARLELGLHPSEFIICTFGLMGPTKLNIQLLEAWLDSGMARDERCRLVFVGAEQAGEYGAQIKHQIKTSGLQHRIHISGWTDPDVYVKYLMAADLAVQLRANSRGETSAAVLDCMNYGLPTIVNAHGALAELPPGTVWMLPEKFSNTSLTQAIDTLWRDDQKRNTLSQMGKELILSRHIPSVCAEQYRDAIEQHHAAAIQKTQVINESLAALSSQSPTEAEFIELAQTIGREIPASNCTRQLLIDVSATCQNDLKTGIQRVVRALVWSLIQAPPDGYRIEPVYLKGDNGVWHYCYAREWTSRSLGFDGGWMPDDPVDFLAGDVLLIADFTADLAVKAHQAGVFSAMKASGIGIHFFVYDLLPIQMPNCFPPGQFGFSTWLTSLVAIADTAICISRAVAQDLRNWMDSFGPRRDQPLHIDWFHLGADLVNSIPSSGLPPDSSKILKTLQTAPSFLMVSTIEPRKGYLQTLQAFTQLWRSELNINLVIVGREGWTALHNDQRQSIPQIVSLIQKHPELGKRLLWLDDVSDEYLAQLYANSVCLIAASEGEGFGLPLIEAAQHGLPIIARDIPVFREVAGDHAFYFEGLKPQDLAIAIQTWLAQEAENKQPLSQSMSWLTWEESTKHVVEILQLVPRDQFVSPNV